MRFLFDVSHPAHVHFFKHVVRSLERRGHGTRIVARDKDVTTALLTALGLPFSTVGRSGTKSRLARFTELVERDVTLARIAGRWKPDVIVTRNPAGAQVGRMLGIRSVFDTDDGIGVGLHFWAAAPFAHVITTPDCFVEDYGRRHVRYPGYKQSAYLHPAHFTPDPSVLDDLGLAPGERFFVVRFVAMAAIHDVGERGLDADAKRRLVRRLEGHGRVFVSHEEGACPSDLAHLRFPLPPDRLHDALAFASMLVGDSQSVAAEAAVLGTPNIRVTSWAGRVPYLVDIERRYGLSCEYTPERVDALFEHLDRWLAEPDLRAKYAENHARLLADKRDIATWYADFLEAGAPTP